MGVRGMSSAPAVSAFDQLRAPHDSPTVILKRAYRREYYVVNTSDWRTCYSGLIRDTFAWRVTSLDEIAECALYQTAERFDTLEQAMLYFSTVVV
jgi:hypothetical protein